jgi:sirohydrochlorin ferrochelatase
VEHAIVIVDHGSRHPAANAVVEDIASLVQARAGSRASVVWAHMELGVPSLPRAIDEAVRRGARSVTVVPFFLAPGRHAAADIPDLVAAAGARHPGVSFRLGEVLGADPAIAELVARRCGFA